MDEKKSSHTNDFNTICPKVTKFNIDLPVTPLVYKRRHCVRL